MHRYIRILSLALVAGAGGVCMAAPQTTLNTHGLLEHSQLDLTLKNVWMLNNTDLYADRSRVNQSAWAQGLHLDYRSGWLDDRLGFDASWYGVAKLHASSTFAGRDLLRDNNGHAEGFTKPGQLYAKVKWGDDAHYVRLYAGWKQLYKFGALTVTRSRAAPSSWEGISLETGRDSLAARAAWVRRFSERDEPEKRRFYTLASGRQIDHIITGDISWRPTSRSRITYLVGESDNYLLRQGLEIDASWPLANSGRLLTRGAYYYNRGLANWEGARGFTHSAQHAFGSLGYQYGATELGVGLTKTWARLNNQLGHFYRHFGKNTRGAFNSPADGEGNDYINNGERMVWLYSHYQLTPELRIGVYSNYGSGARYQGINLTEWEYGGYFSWSPRQLAGLTFFAGFGPSYSWKLRNGQPWLKENKRGFHRAKGVGGAVRVEYRTGLF